MADRFLTAVTGCRIMDHKYNEDITEQDWKGVLSGVYKSSKDVLYAIHCLILSPLTYIRTAINKTGKCILYQNIHSFHMYALQMQRNAILIINYLECSVIHFLQQNRLSSDITMAT
jgi:hypothetical protein